MIKKSTFIQTILFFHCLVFGGDTLFKDVPQNGFYYTEFRIILKGEKISKDDFWKDCQTVIRNLCDTIVLSSVDVDFALYPPIPAKYTKGTFLCRKSYLCFYRRTFKVHVLLDEKHGVCCLWSFITEPTGKSVKGVKGINKKIANELIRKKVMSQFVLEYTL